MIPEQITLWDKKHLAGEHDKLRGLPSPLALLSEPYFASNSTILELGCGVGRDAIYFAETGHQILATDGSNIVIQQNKKSYINDNVVFMVLDMQEMFPFEDAKFDVVYANLSLHYYSHQKTREIMDEITRILKINGILAFACKSVDDFHHGNGEQVEKNVFISPKGHVRHLFTKKYATQVLEGLLVQEYLDQIEEEYNGQKSNIVRCIAKKPQPKRM